MILRAIVLDSTPLGLIVNRPGSKHVDQCRDWLKNKLEARIRIYVPSIIMYELRRELLRIGSMNSLTLLDKFSRSEPGRYIPLTDAQLMNATELWASARKRGIPTADRHALDIDMILSAQTLSLGLAAEEYVVASSNLAHLTPFVTARLWQEI